MIHTNILRDTYIIKLHVHIQRKFHLRHTVAAILEGKMDSFQRGLTCMHLTSHSSNAPKSI